MSLGSNIPASDIAPAKYFDIMAAEWKTFLAATVLNDGQIVGYCIYTQSLGQVY